MLLLDGKATAQALRQELAQETARLAEQYGRTPHLAVVLVGDDPASQIYVRNKEKACADAGIRSTAHRVEAEIGQAALESLVSGLNADPDIDGILVQAPLPRGLNLLDVQSLVDPAKDVDGFHPVSVGRLSIGLPSLPPCTPAGVMFLLEKYGIPCSGRKAVVVGRSNIVGKPMALMLTKADATVTVCHSRTRNLADECRQADILVAAIGRAKMITADMVKPGAVVMDVGMNRDESGLCGDVDFASVKEVASAITPVPGGIGPMTIAMLLKNTVQAYLWRMGA
ncbi:Bifunctional protein FolD protein [Fundidesulfovibrio magnetotacticus]|uniref:Bifunctional protein FolD n=1 Tax=Fundidesulfovibrio magnetotacticus TaxID=2730080 RepID=A0A6V8LTD9_9BACT|nr:bifunctional methylenetetrahydrofolate dehydrogenase/methenyltetrahydrofolate cyclohydrolase FolD [Fundidesulfovibrio magnetotacticus]GFK93588.1 Bifunctional protein FolD protein [Fundidesulfovibrio magnetotacticus]